VSQLPDNSLGAVHPDMAQVLLVVALVGVGIGVVALVGVGIGVVVLVGVGIGVAPVVCYVVGLFFLPAPQGIAGTEP